MNKLEWLYAGRNPISSIGPILGSNIRFLSIYDTELKKITKTVDMVIRIPENINISDEVSDIHGITNFISQTSQYKIEDALKHF